VRRLLLAVALAFLSSVPAARADGDPASDILLGQDVYYGNFVDLRSAAAGRLPALLAASRERGYELKVALITAPEDLGVVGFVWSRPQEYARYLGEELTYVYHGTLLILMPNGYGIFRDGKVPGPERRALARLEPPRRTERFLDAASDAARALAGTAGIELPDRIEPQGASRGSATHTPAATATPAAAQEEHTAQWLFLTPVGVFIAAGAFAAARARRR
jgi:hypothetical protein